MEVDDAVCNRLELNENVLFVEKRARQTPGGGRGRTMGGRGGSSRASADRVWNSCGVWTSADTTVMP